MISGVSIITTHIRGLITPLIARHEPPSRVWHLSGQVSAEVGLRSEEQANHITSMGLGA